MAVNFVKLYQDLPPGERINRLFDEKISPFLTTRGFKFYKSKSIFKRKVGQFTQEISISKGKWNKADEICSFWLIFSVTADSYNSWHKLKYGVLPLNNCVRSFYHNHLKNWKTIFKLEKYNLSAQDNNIVFSEIRENLENLVLPLFDNYENYEKSADILLDNKEYWWAAKIYDYYLIAGKSDKAKRALELGQMHFDKRKDPPLELFEAFKLRLIQNNCS